MAYEYEMTLDEALKAIPVDEHAWEEEMIRLNQDLQQFTTIVSSDEEFIDASEEAWWVKE